MSVPDLTPATFEGDSKNRYRPRLPWRRIGLFVLVVALGVGAYFWRQSVRADELRAAMEAQYAAQVAPITGALSVLRGDIEKDALSAQSGAANRLVDTDLRLSELHDQRVVYLIVDSTELGSPERFRGAIDKAHPNAIGACLGLTLIELSALSEVPDVLSRDWLDAANDTNDLLRLRIKSEQLAQAIPRELPRIKALSDADYFLLLVVQGKDRLRDPVDLFLWDLKKDQLLLRSRTENHGKLITVKSQIGPANGGSKPTADNAVAVADCSIVAHLKAQLGEPTTSSEASD